MPRLMREVALLAGSQVDPPVGRAGQRPQAGRLFGAADHADVGEVESGQGLDASYQWLGKTSGASLERRRVRWGPASLDLPGHRGVAG